MRTRPETVEFVAHAPMTVVVERDLAAPPAAVFDVLADAPSWTEWWPGMTVAEWTSADRGGVGSTRRVRVRGLEVHERFIAWDPGERWGFTFERTNLPLARAGVELVELAPTTDGTHVRYTMALQPPRLMGALVRTVAPRFQAGIRDGVDGLARYLDAD